MGATYQIVSKKVILVFEPTLLVVIRIWFFYEWVISLFIKDKAMINSAYAWKQISKEVLGDDLTLTSKSKIDLARLLPRALLICFLTYTEVIIALPFINELMTHL